MRPVRIQLSRKAGFKLQADSFQINGLPCVKVDRTTRWGNPYVVGGPVDLEQVRRWGWLFSPDGKRVVCETADIAVRRFALCVAFDEAIHGFVRQELGGKNLACWCRPQDACHADVLLELANADTSERPAKPRDAS